MPSPPILSFETLLAPIPGENPAGESLQYEGTYDAIEKARRADDTMDKGVWQKKGEDIKTAD